MYQLFLTFKKKYAILYIESSKENELKAKRKVDNIMTRTMLEKSYLDCYEVAVNFPTELKVLYLSNMSTKYLASKVYQAAQEMRDDGINWFGSDFEDELLAIMDGTAEIEEPDTHITIKEYEEIRKAQEEFLKKYSTC